MEERAVQDIFIKILACELTQTPLEKSCRQMLTPETMSELYALAKKQDLAHVAASALDRAGLLDTGESSRKFKNEEFKSIYRYEQMKYAYSKVCDALGGAGVDYVPLKGAVIRQHYPRESMRTSCDIDILVREEQLQSAIDALTQSGFSCGERNYHDISLYSSGNVHLELHFNIKENIAALDAVLEEVWEHTQPSGGRCEYVFSPEFFMFHLYAHLYYHFVNGGCGIRPLMDIWIIEQKTHSSYTDAKELLERAGIYKFAREMSHLADVCFSCSDVNEDDRALLSYIFDGGLYGTELNRLRAERAQEKSGGGYLLKRLFLPYREMCKLFPVLLKCPILLPFCYIARFFGALFGSGSKRTLAKIRRLEDMNEGQISDLQKIQERLGITQP